MYRIEILLLNYIWATINIAYRRVSDATKVADALMLQGYETRIVTIER